MALSVERAGDSWHDALNLHKLLMRNLQKLHGSVSSGVEALHFEAIDTCLDRYRLACVSTIFHDFEYAVSQRTEDALWAVHVSIKKEYARIIARANQHNPRSLESRKLREMYSNFLSIAHYFYKTYIQRLNARYGIDELKRAAAGIHVQQPATEDTISPVAQDLRAKVLTSCHHTLIHLGDLTRYRIQGNIHTSSSVAAALTYYGLAHHLEPESGFAHHQMGIVHLNQGDHLEIVYHFYRAWTVEKPHPMAKSNLELAFKTTLHTGQSARRASPCDRGAAALKALTTWFVRLHAHFYKGQTFGPKQEEIEKEVWHRLDTFSLDASSRLTVVKMALVNMAAHYVSSERYNRNQTDADSALSYQYILCFNIRFIIKVCGHLKSELEESLSEKEHPDTKDDNESLAGCDTYLPILRIYCLWLAANRQEVFGAADALGLLIPKMTQALARVFTLLCVETYDQANIKTAPFLLEEDVEGRGFMPLSKDRLPKACRIVCDEAGNSKPYLSVVQLPRDWKNVDSIAARTLDVLRCAYFFTEDEDVPLAYRIEENSLLFEYRPAEMPSQPPTLDTPTSNLSGEAADPSHHEDQGRTGQARPVLQDPIPAADESQPEMRIDTNLEKPNQEFSHSRSFDPGSDMDDADSTVINMLTPFLKPPTPQPQQQPRSPTESSFGMHSSTADELFASIDPGPTPTKSISSGRFEPLPWGWFNTPNPHQAQDRALPGGKDAFQKHYSAAASPRIPVAAPNLPEDPFATPGRPYFNTFGRSTASESADPSGDVDAGKAHRERLLQTLGASGLSQMSMFSQWSQNPSLPTQDAPASSGRDPRTVDGLASVSSTSAFPPSASLHHGTPTGGARYSGLALGEPANSGSQDLPSREAGLASARQYQVDKTASNYDEAILRAAYLGLR